MKNTRLIIRLKNNILVTLRERQGVSQAELARRLKIPPTVYGQIENLKRSPIKLNNLDWTIFAKRISNYFHLLPEDLFPKDLMKIKKTRIEKEIDIKDIADVLTYSQQVALPVNDLYEIEERNKKIHESLHKLTNHEREVIEKRFGLYGEEQTLEQIGVELGYTRERVRQIEEIALGKLKNKKSINKEIRQYVDAQ